MKVMTEWNRKIFLLDLNRKKNCLISPCLKEMDRTVAGRNALFFVFPEGKSGYDHIQSSLSRDVLAWSVYIRFLYFTYVSTAVSSIACQVL